MLLYITSTSRGWTTTDRHTSSPCGTPEKAGGTWGDNGRDGLTSSKDFLATNDPEVRKTECCGKNLKKRNFNSIGLAHL